MESFYAILCFSLVCKSHTLIHPSNGLHECRKDMALTALEVLPGGGWDNLRNKDMGRVMNLSYSQCQTTEDGAYLIPDEVFVIPQKISILEPQSEIIMSWLKQKSCTSRSINAEASFFSMLNGKFSEEHKQIKTHQVKENSVTSRVQVRNHLYTVNAFPDFTLDIRFVHQAKKIAEAIENKQTRQATYLSEKLILDYGTHVITSVDAGAILVKEDYLKSTYVFKSQSDTSSVLATASLNFENIININFTRKEFQKTFELDDYRSNITYSKFQSYGGALFYPGLTLQKWQESTHNNLVAIDRSGLPLHYFLNPTTFPELPKQTVVKLYLSVKQAVERYYKINTIPGCIDPKSKNFDFQANVDDESCEGPVTSLSFGGIYQICTPLTSEGNVICDELAQKNPATGDYSCSQPYNASLLHSETIIDDYHSYECHTGSETCYLFFSCDKQICQNVYHARHAEIKTYFCFTNDNVPEYSGYLFGGIFGPSLENPLTKSHGCPSNYIGQRFLSNGMIVCLSKEYEKGTQYSVPFGGFFSCSSGNPLSWGQKRCPPQFSQELAAIRDGCEILYCVQSRMFTGGDLEPVILPPFTNPPLISMTLTKTVAVMTEGNQTWVRMEGNNTWQLVKLNEVNQMLKLLDGSSKQLSGGKIAGIVIGAIIFVLFIIVVIGIYKKRKRSQSSI